MLMEAWSSMMTTVPVMSQQNGWDVLEFKKCEVNSIHWSSLKEFHRKI